MGVCTPVNDARIDALDLGFPVSGTEAVVRGSTVNASRDGAQVPCGASAPNVWYRFTLDREMVLWLDTSGSDFDTALFLTDDMGEPVRGWCNSDCGCGGAGTFTDDDSCDYGVLDAGTYYVSVGGVATSTGRFALHAQRLDPPGQLFASRLDGEGHTSLERLEGINEADGSCYSPAMSSPEHAYWFVSCGDARPHTLSTCPADDASVFFDPFWVFERNGRLFDPVLYVRSAIDGRQSACNNDNVGVDCFDDADRENLGARLADITLGRGLHSVIVDSRTGGPGMTYRMRHVLPRLDRSPRR